MTRGGARPGSGPKPKPDAMVTRAFVIRRDQADWIDTEAREQGMSKSEFMRALIDEYRA